MRPIATTPLLVLVALLVPVSLTAQRQPSPEALQASVVAPAGFVATPAPVPLAAIASELDPAAVAEAAEFRAAHGDWRFYVDRRSAAIALAEGEGIVWFSAGDPGDLERLETLGREFVRAHPSLLPFSPSDLVLDADATRRFGERGQFWNLAFRQRLDGVEVADSQLVFRVSHGNLVQFGATRLFPSRNAARAPEAAARVSPDSARAALLAHVGGGRVGDVFVEPERLLWVLRGAADRVGYAGPVGEGWELALVYRSTFMRVGSGGSWRALVDAGSGEVLRFVDATDYASLLKASVYPNVNCSNPSACVPGDVAEVTVTMPNAQISFVGGACVGDACYTNSAGAFEYPAGAVSALTSLSGKYFTLVDGCGPIQATAVSPGDLDLGTSDPNGLGTNTDCQPATRESEPGSDPLTAGLGDTHAARNAYYHLNLINQKSRFYLPENDWLKGVDGGSGPASLLTNAAPVCNAFWQGGTGTLAFFKQVQPQFCNNTGELAGVFLHEFGHGLDQNDGTGTAPESATGEAMGDTFATLQTLSSCIGLGFRLPDPTEPAWGTAAGYGSRSRLCSGVRDIDYTRYCRYSNTFPIPSPEGCVAPTDPDELNGSRSGSTPPPEPASHVGTPARFNHMISGALPLADGQSNYYNCGGPETTGCAGPLNHGCHCESLIASQANWDLARLLVAQEFGGSVYAAAQGPAEHAGWQTMDRLWYLTRDLAISGYSVTGPAPEGTTNGCTATDWFSAYRFVDDNDGNLANGTPHAAQIFAAFDLHAIACGVASDPANQDGGCPAPVAAPSVAALCTTAPIQLGWESSPEAGGYRILRNTLGCGFGFTPIAEVSGDREYFEDSEVAPGVPYYYAVQSVGAHPSCLGQVSSCVEILPQACEDVALPPPANPVLDASVDNQIEVSWGAVGGAVSYKILRREGGCAASEESEAAVGVVTAPTTQFVDSDGIMGGLTYGYRVAASDDACPSCTGEASVCVEATAAGDCALAPLFGGASGVSSATNGICRLNVAWEAGTPRCGAALTYDVYRSTDPDFVPESVTLIASGVSGTDFVDYGVLPDERYFYVVRARDSEGNDDGNVIRRYEVATGALTDGSFSDDAGDLAPARLYPAFNTSSSWAVRLNDTGHASRVYATTASGPYLDNSCSALETPTLRLGAAPALGFSSRYAMEQGWDGGIVQVATEAGGFSDWTLLDSVNYPGVMGGPAGSPACNLPEFDDLAPVFTGTSVGYSAFTGSLSEYADQAVRLRFLFSSDGATNDEGWFLDDLTVDAVRVAGTCETVAPVAVPDAFAIPPFAPPVTLDVLGNDLDNSETGLDIVAVTQPPIGSVTINDLPGGDTLTYTRGANPCPVANVIFTYTIEDGLGISTSTSVTLDLLADLPFLDNFESGGVGRWCDVEGLAP